MLQGAKFCENCRSTNLVRRKEYKKEQEIISRDNQAAQLQQKHRFNKKREAKQYCAYVSKCRYCPECGNVNPPEVIYCGQCGVKTNRVPEDYVYNWMKDTYPDIIQNQNDLEGLEKIPDAEEITVGSVVAKSTIAVAKGGFWVGKWFVKSLAKELAKK
jgi:hypothetical protein